jgi:hypothetical protein
MLRAAVASGRGNDLERVDFSTARTELEFGEARAYDEDTIASNTRGFCC